MARFSESINFHFSISERKIFLFLIDHIIGVAGIYLYYFLIGKEIDTQFYITTGIFLGLSSLLNAVFKTYDLKIASSIDRLDLILFVSILVYTVLFLSSSIVPRVPQNDLKAIFLVLSLPLLVTSWRLFYIKVIHQPVLHTNAMILGESECIDFLKETFDFDSHGYKILHEEIYDDNKEIEDFRTILDNLKASRLNIVILAYNEYKNMPNYVSRITEYCSVIGIEVYGYLRFYESVNLAIPIRRLGNNLYRFFPFTRTNYNLVYKGTHRLIDIFSALFGLLFLLIVLPFIAILNIFFNPGPLFFEQLRVGKGGEEIPILKLRSMVVDAEKKSGAIMATKNDARVTPFGKILRKFRFDELPQFWTVLKGDMSLIGPRPERKVFVEQLKKEMPVYDLRHMIKPGITGWAQVKYKYGENLEDSYRKLEYDLYYIKYRSLFLDIRIILDTVNTVIFSKGQ
ncbi:MAG: exopolysaccharide biosynthesis polyprenyl glycosylphosphotransferase [Cytophagales bacterium]|nr:exopolysaccharide biosynthesis polyprenyl glycosylphosphotransferase [Cytophagales bacterium]